MSTQSRQLKAVDSRIILASNISTILIALRQVDIFKWLWETYAEIFTANDLVALFKAATSEGSDPRQLQTLLASNTTKRLLDNATNSQIDELR